MKQRKVRRKMFMFTWSCTEFLPKTLINIQSRTLQLLNRLKRTPPSHVLSTALHKNILALGLFHPQTLRTDRILARKEDLKRDSPNGTFNLHNTTIFHLHKGMGLSLITDYPPLHQQLRQFVLQCIKKQEKEVIFRGTPACTSLFWLLPAK